MKLEKSPMRRVIVAVTGITLTAILLRSQLAAALVARGDDLLYQSNSKRALEFYRRAAALDPNNDTAIDRYVFVSMLAHRVDMLREAVLVASAFLDRHPNAESVIMDRALCEHLLRDDERAERDFVHVGLHARNARALVFAGYSAFRMGKTQRARRWWHDALAIRPTYLPALRALRKR